MRKKLRLSTPKIAQDNLQEFINYSIQQYDGFGRVLSRALKTSVPLSGPTNSNKVVFHKKTVRYPTNLL
ncbi:MAG: hypothetical protein M3Q14_03325 [bacterium]|nr:hypothetical protein [bacterium]